MKKTGLRLAGKQQGAFYSTAVIVVMFGLFLTAALKIAPAYIDNNVIQNAMNGLAENNDMSTMTIREIRTGVMKTLNTNNVTLDAQNIQLVTISGTDFIDINYDAQVHLFYNISAVVSFTNRFEKE